MPVSPELRDYILDLLAPLGNVTAKSMFGGAGIYRDGIMFALITGEDVVYLRTDDGNRAAFEDAGMKPFVPFADGRMTMPYHQAPAEVMEDSDEMCAWGGQAWEAARRNRKKKPQGRNKAKKKAKDRRRGP